MASLSLKLGMFVVGLIVTIVLYSFVPLVSKINVTNYAYMHTQIAKFDQAQNCRAKLLLFKVFSSTFELVWPPS